MRKPIVLTNDSREIEASTIGSRHRAARKDSREINPRCQEAPITDEIAAVLIHVHDVAAALDWYQAAFPRAQRYRVSAEFEVLEIGTVALEIVAEDEKVASGPAGTVVYWRVDDLNHALQRLIQNGATLYRGPLAIEDALWMCQVRDPWGNCIGLRGPRAD